jgi:hypothetical protein
VYAVIGCAEMQLVTQVLSVGPQLLVQLSSALQPVSARQAES